MERLSRGLNRLGGARQLGLATGSRPKCLGLLAWATLAFVAACAGTSDRALRALVEEMAPAGSYLDAPRDDAFLGFDPDRNQILVDNAPPAGSSFSDREIAYSDLSKFNADFAWANQATAALSSGSDFKGTARLTGISVREIKSPQLLTDSAVAREAIRKNARTFTVPRVCRLELLCESLVFSGLSSANTSISLSAVVERLGLTLSADASTQTIRAGRGEAKKVVLAREFADLEVAWEKLTDKPGGATMDIGNGYAMSLTNVKPNAPDNADEYTLNIARPDGKVSSQTGRFGFTPHIITSSGGTTVMIRIGWTGAGSYRWEATEFRCWWKS